MLQSSQPMRSMSKAGRDLVLMLVLMKLMMKQPVLRRVLSLVRDCSSSASRPTFKSRFEISKKDIKLCSEIGTRSLSTIEAAHLASSDTSQ